MRKEDYDGFKAVIDDLCTAFNRPLSNDVVRVYYESLKGEFLEDVRQRAMVLRGSAKKFPSPADLRSEREKPKRPQWVDPGAPMSRWAIAANKIMFQLAYLDKRRGFLPLADLLPQMLNAKFDYVRMAEEADARGEPWSDEEFIELVYEGLQKILGTKEAA